MREHAPADLQVFFHQAQRTGLDPFARQIYMVEYGGKPTIQTGIDGFRLVANRAARRERVKYSKGAPEWADETGTWHSVWSRAKHNGQQPTAARVTVVKDGEQFTAVLMFEEFVARRRDGNPNMMWSTKGAHMLSKCAEAAALRMAFPNDLAGLYTDDEMAAVREHTVSSRVVSAPCGSFRLRAGYRDGHKGGDPRALRRQGHPEAEQGSGVVAVVGRSVRGLDDLTEDEGKPSSRACRRSRMRPGSRTSDPVRTRGEVSVPTTRRPAMRAGSRYARATDRHSRRRVATPGLCGEGE